MQQIMLRIALFAARCTVNRQGTSMNHLQRTEFQALSGFGTKHYFVLGRQPATAVVSLKLAEQWHQYANAARSLVEYKRALYTERLYLLEAVCINHKRLAS